MEEEEEAFEARFGCTEVHGAADAVEEEALAPFEALLRRLEDDEEEEEEDEEVTSR